MGHFSSQAAQAMFLCHDTDSKKMKNLNIILFSQFFEAVLGGGRVKKQTVTEASIETQY